MEVSVAIVSLFKKLPQIIILIYQSKCIESLNRLSDECYAVLINLRETGKYVSIFIVDS